MKNISKEDFKLRSTNVMQPRINLELEDIGSSGSHVYAIVNLYQLYLFGRWSHGKNVYFKTIGHIDSVETLPDLAWLLRGQSLYILYHKSHPKFGQHIIECVNRHRPNYFSFFDYKSLEYVFDALDNDKPMPHIPTYYAEIYDRYDYKTNTHEWGDGSPTELRDMYADLRGEEKSS